MAIVRGNRCDCANSRGPARALDPPVNVTQCQAVVRDSFLSGDQQASQVGRSSYGPLNQQEHTRSFPGRVLALRMMPGHVG